MSSYNGFVGEMMHKIREFFKHDPDQDEWAERRVPDSERLGVWEPATVWIGFAIAFSIAFIGSQIYFGLGMPEALYAIVLGNVFLAIYSSLIAVASVDGGLNFPLQMKEAFGKKGALLPIAVVGLLVNGWYAFQAWLAADVVRAAWDPSWYILVIGVVILFGLPSLIGVGAMSDVVEKLVIPIMLMFAAYILFVQVIPAGTSILSQPAPGESIPFFVGVGLTWGTFAVSGTATGDIVRFAEDSKQAVLATIIAFLICNTSMMVLGALSAAALNSLDPYFGMIGLLGSIPVVAVAVVSLWSTCDACHYNATMSYTNLSSIISWRIAGVLGILGALVTATTEVISNLENWLNLISILVPPIGGIIIADYFLLRRGFGYAETRVSNYNWAAIASFAAAVGVNYYAYVNHPQVLPGLAGLLFCLVVYPIIVKVGVNVLGRAQMGSTFEPHNSVTKTGPADD
ncbi:cytosine permease [Natronorubrum daqingense]|uniref:Cytosine permease n=2 Tax=Natronorubrum daqingense TaxID=588898 RepID=A0A1N7G1P2_9EURY|nr:cytosine permease [Natronorubrum daqingense]SIS06502.1 cytosine permease [Natronorubrum daqingense]